jgi:hypothetical protein
MWFQGIGKVLILVGVFMVILGLSLLLWHRVPFLGRLPGDIFVQKGDLQLFLPVATCFIVSILLTVAVNLITHLLK